jgi:CRP-like cAMP-binding protein
MLHLNDSDLRFLVETVATDRRDYDHIVNLVRDKDDLLEPMLQDPKLIRRLLEEEQNLVRVSPYFLFTVLLLQVWHDLEDAAYILEVDFKGKRIPVFEAQAVTDLLAQTVIRDYLAEMLASFTRTNSGVIYWRERGAWHKRRFSDLDIDDMVDLTRIMDPELRPALYKRIADIALFLCGIFPDHLTVFAASHQTRFAAKRTLKDHEQQGSRLYRIAAQETDQSRWRPAMETLAEKFTLARWALNTLGDRYLKPQREHYFRSPNRDA